MEAFRAAREKVSDTFADLGEGEDEGAYWRFSAENLTAQEQEIIPGIRSFLIDKGDGHLWSEAEAAAFVALSSM